MIRIFIALLGLLPLKARDYDLVILAGQSNAQGWAANGKHYPEDSEDTRVPFYYDFPMMGSSDGKWIPLGPQPGRFAKGHFGPEASFATELLAAGQSPAIFKFTLAGSSLDTAWKGPGEGGLYDQMCRSYQQAVSRLRKDGHKVRLRAFIWIQGEADAIDPGSAARYEENLTELLKHFRTRVAGQANLPIILGVDELNPYVVRRPIIIAAQENIARRDKNIQRTSMVGLRKADRTHLKPSGVIQHGKRLSAAYLDLLLKR